MPVVFLIFAKRGYQYAGLGPLISSINFFADQPPVLLAGRAKLVGNATCVCGNAAAPGLLPLLVAGAGWLSSGEVSLFMVAMIRCRLHRHPFWMMPYAVLRTAFVVAEIVRIEQRAFRLRWPRSTS
jgi:hypothetical protein